MESWLSAVVRVPPCTVRRTSLPLSSISVLFFIATTSFRVINWTLLFTLSPRLLEKLFWNVNLQSISSKGCVNTLPAAVQTAGPPSCLLVLTWPSYRFQDRRRSSPLRLMELGAQYFHLSLKSDELFRQGHAESPGIQEHSILDVEQRFLETDKLIKKRSHRS